jgi:TRAP-type C4-dicarboxylate transport system permease small subunit
MKIGEIEMGSSALPVVSNRGMWPRRVFTWIACAVLAALALRFFGNVVARYTHFDLKHYGENHWTERWWLVAHLLGGSLALLLGPFQFVNGLRKRYVQVHRWMGMVYLTDVLLGSVAGVEMGVHAAIRGFGIGLLYLDVAWVVTTGMAYLAVLRKQYAAHREWMIRSYVVTFAFVTFRLMGRDLHLYASLGVETELTMLSWLCWAIPLLFTEVVLQWKRTVGG